jgi:hypothetical protein
MCVIPGSERQAEPVRHSRLRAGPHFCFCSHALHWAAAGNIPSSRETTVSRKGPMSHPWIVRAFSFWSPERGLTREA